MPTHLTPDGCALHYRIVGEGPLIALTPGGREGGDALAALTAELTKGARVLTWDRRNAGRSDLYFGDDIRSEQEISPAVEKELSDFLDGLVKTFA